MNFQPVFTVAYYRELLRQVKNNESLERYAQKEFQFDSSQTAFIKGLEHPGDLLRKMKPQVADDCDSAIALYEAYPEMTPLQASDKALWVYLAHVDLFPYIQTRYPADKRGKLSEGEHIIKHWFYGGKDGKRLFDTLDALWWIVHMTIDPENQEDKYKYTRQTFKDTHYRTNFLNYSLARNKEMVFGLYDFLNNNPEITSEHFRPRFRFMTKYLNRLGGVKLLSAFPRDYFYNELMIVKDQILAQIKKDTRKETELDEDED